MFPTAVGPLKCDPLYNTSVVTLVMLSMLVFIMMICACFSITFYFSIRKNVIDKTYSYLRILYFCAGIFGITLVVFVIAGSILAFDSTAAINFEECGFFYSGPKYSMVFSLAIISSFFSCWLFYCFKFRKVFTIC